MNQDLNPYEIKYPITNFSLTKRPSIEEYSSFFSFFFKALSYMKIIMILSLSGSIAFQETLSIQSAT